MTEPIFATRAVSGEPTTLDPEARTVDVVWTTGARARNWVRGLGEIIEELDLSPNAVRMGVLQGGTAPVLDSHQSYGARSVLGRVTAARMEPVRGVATLQFSAADDVAVIWQRIADGSLRSVSVGYRVYRYEQIIDPNTKVTVHRAVDWEPYEISMVPIPIDRAAAVRGEGGAPSDANPHHQPQGAHPMPPEAPAQPAVVPPAPPAPTPTDANRGNPPADIDAVRAEAERSVRERIAGYEPILADARPLLSADVIDAQRSEAIRDGITPEVLRSRLWTAYVAAGSRPSVPARPESGPSNDDPAVIREAMAEAIVASTMQGYRSENARHTEFLGWRPSDMIAELLIRRGERSVPRNPALLAERAFHTTSDFPLLLASAGNKMLMTGYQLANPSYRRFFAKRAFKDFKAHSFLTAGDFPALAPLAEAGGITQGTISEKREQITAQTHARGVSVTRQMLVNDDLGAFTDFGAMIGRRVADYENALAYAVLNTASGDGPTLTEGNAAVFTTGRGNKAGSGAAVTALTLGAAFSAMKKAKSLDGLALNLSPSYLVCSPGMEFEAAKFGVSITSPSAPSGVNVFSGRYETISDANIADYRWYLFASPAAAPVYVYGYVGGNESPQIRVGPQAGVDGVLVEVIHDFAVGAVDYRGGYFNPGAAPS